MIFEDYNLTQQTIIAFRFCWEYLKQSEPTENLRNWGTYGHFMNWQKKNGSDWRQIAKRKWKEFI